MKEKNDKASLVKDEIIMNEESKGPVEKI